MSDRPRAGDVLCSGTLRRTYASSHWTVAPRRTCHGWAQRQWPAASDNRAANPCPAGTNAICRMDGVTPLQRLV
jgi:hypothetical protein